MTVKHRPVPLTADEALTIYKVLTELAVSLDQIGGKEAMGDEHGGEYVDRYFSDDGATIRLSKARRAIIDAFDRVYSDDEIENIATDIVYWADLHPEA